MTKEDYPKEKTPWSGVTKLLFWGIFCQKCSRKKLFYFHETVTNIQNFASHEISNFTKLSLLHLPLHPSRKLPEISILVSYVQCTLYIMFMDSKVEDYTFVTYICMHPFCYSTK